MFNAWVLGIERYLPSGLLGEVKNMHLGFSFSTASAMSSTFKLKSDFLGTGEEDWKEKRWAQSCGMFLLLSQIIHTKQKIKEESISNTPIKMSLRTEKKNSSAIDYLWQHVPH